MLTAFLLDRRVAELVDVGATVEAIVDAMTSDNATRIIEEHLSPAWDRHRERCEASGEQLQQGFPDGARNELVQIFAAQRLPKVEWAEGAIDPALLKELLAPVLQDTLIAFAKRTALGGGDEDGRLGGIAGRLRKGVEKRASKIASAGKSALGGLGAELDKRMAAAAREFSGTAQRQLRESLRQRLKSERGRELSAELRRQIITRVFETDVAVLMREVETLPGAELEALLGPVVAHNATRAITRQAIEQELRAFLNVEGGKSVSGLLDELGIADQARRAVEATLDSLARELFASKVFAAWLDEVLAV